VKTVTTQVSYTCGGQRITLYDLHNHTRTDDEVKTLLLAITARSKVVTSDSRRVNMAMLFCVYKVWSQQLVKARMLGSAGVHLVTCDGSIYRSAISHA